jgi:tetratricopeptide (TPR) repeat protein
MKLARVLAALAMLVALPGVAFCAHTTSAARARSDALVKQAEATVMQAGKTDPIATKLIDRAIDQLHQALKVDPRNDSAYVDLGFCYSALRDGPKAEDMYRTATLINPSPANFKELADIYLRTGDAERALMAANAGLAKEPKNAKLLNAKGIALSDLQRPDEAEAAFRQAVKYDPSLKVAQQNLDALSTEHRRR